MHLVNVKNMVLSSYEKSYSEAHTWYLRVTLCLEDSSLDVSSLYFALVCD